MQPITAWTFVQLIVYVAVWVIIFSVGWIIYAKMLKKRNKGIK